MLNSFREGYGLKKCCFVILLAFALCGCAAKETFETVSDEIIAPVMAQPREVSVRLPENAVSPVLETDTRQVYMSDGYEIVIETLSSGDLNDTIQSLSGYNREQLTVLETQEGSIIRYDFVWASAGENGDRLGRGVILDDGSYHYCLSVLRDSDDRKVSQIVWSDVFFSFTLI